jgi:YVTN family beta-propeller protein
MKRNNQNQQDKRSFASGLIGHTLLTVMTNLLVFTLLMICTSCDKNQGNNDQPEIPPKSKQRVLIGNEGNFQSGSASLTILDLAENKTYNDAFKSINGRPLGDVLESINKNGNLFYLVINNSQKIEIINSSDFKSVATFNGFKSPRFIEFASNEKAYVSEMYSPDLLVVNPVSRTIIKRIHCGSDQEELKIVGRKLYVTCSSRDQVYVIDVQSDMILDSVKVAANPLALCVDQQNNLWVGCNGTNATKASVWMINTTNDSVVKSVQMKDNLLRRMAINKKLGTLYVLSNIVSKLNVGDDTPAPTTFVNPTDNKSNFYGIGVNPYNGEVYVADARDYVERSVVLRYNTTGSLVAQFNAGQITGSFYFDYE